MACEWCYSRESDFFLDSMVTTEPVELRKSAHKRTKLIFLRVIITVNARQNLIPMKYKQHKCYI